MTTVISSDTAGRWFSAGHARTSTCSTSRNAPLTCDAQPMLANRQ